MIQLIIVVGIAFVLQGVLTTLQMKNLSDEFVKLRRQGRVAFGRQAGGFRAGAVVMFQIDDDGIIRQGRQLEGVTAFARVKPLEGFEGRNVADLTEADGPKNHKNLCKAIHDAALTYRKFVAGEEIPDPPSPFQKVGMALGNLAQGHAEQNPES